MYKRQLLYKGRLDTARIEQKRYETIRKGIVDAKSHALRNRYTLEIYDQTNELFHYPVRLLLALEAYDLSRKKGKGQEDAKARIKDVCFDFIQLREKFESIYSCKMCIRDSSLGIRMPEYGSNQRFRQQLYMGLNREMRSMLI